MSHLLRHFLDVPTIVGQVRNKYEPDPDRFSHFVQALGGA
jgi:hypothetical protein